MGDESERAEAERMAATWRRVAEILRGIIEAERFQGGPLLGRPFPPKPVPPLPAERAP